MTTTPKLDAIRPITRAEWEAVRWGQQFLSPEGRALLAAPLNTGLAVPCRWPHNKKSERCRGTGMASQLAKAHNFKVRTRCVDGTFYVWKEAKP